MRAECHTNSDLATTPADDVRDHAVDTDRAQNQRHRSCDREQRHCEREPDHGARDYVFHRPDITEWNIGIHLLEDTSKRSGQYGWWYTGRPKHDRHRPHRSFQVRICNRKQRIEDRLGRWIAQSRAVNVVTDSYDTIEGRLAPTEFDPLADRVLPGPQPRGQRPGDDDASRMRLDVAPSWLRAAQLDAECTEIPR